jgi:pimeloyl-ACP methyl ester carboxylesterase
MRRRWKICASMIRMKMPTRHLQVRRFDAMVDVQLQPIIWRVPTNGIELSVAEYGISGPPLLLLHGIGSRYVSWFPVIDQLAAHFRLIAPDFRGHGDSDKPVSGYLHTDYAADLDGLVKALEIEQPSIIGHSLGAIVAYAWAGTNSSSAGKIVLEDPPTRTGPDDAALLDGWLTLASMTVVEAEKYYRERYPDWSAEDRYRRAISITSTSPAVFRELRDQSLTTGGIDRLSLLPAVETPLLIIYGELTHGGMSATEDVIRIEQSSPNARAVQIPGGGHSLHRDSTDAFLAAALPFLLDGSV